MSGHKSWDSIKRDLDEKYPSVPKDKLKPGKFWKNGWSRKDKQESPKRWKLHKKQRIKYGYSEIDWWSFDSYIAGVIAHACMKFAHESHGHPADITAQQWSQYCLSIAEPLALWASPHRWRLSADDSMALYEEAQQALRMFAERFGSFWD